MRYQSVVVAVLAATLLAGCDQLPALGASTEVTPEAPVVRDLVEETKARGLTGYTGGKTDVVIPAVLQNSVLPEGWLRVSGTLDNPTSNGTTRGVSFKMPEGLEEQVSGKLINVHVVTSSESDGEAFLAYSTNEVGNSGWTTFPVTTEDSVTTLRYKVPVMREGRGDYVGINPNGHTLTIKAIVIEIVSED